MTRAPLAFFWGDDELGVDRAVDGFAAAVAGEDGPPPERWDLHVETGSPDRQLGDLLERVATPVMFGGGTLAVVTNLAPLVRSTAGRDAVVSLLDAVAPGNALAFAEVGDSGRKDAPHKSIADAVAARGGEVRQFRAPRGEALTGWIEQEARQRQMRLASGAATELATRIGAAVREGDADRRGQTRLAVMELDKLQLYRPDSPVSAEDVKALVPEAIPTSIWEFTDAVGRRDVARAGLLFERMAATTPEPVVIAVLHRRVRELLELADRLDAGESLLAAARAMKIGNEFRAKTLALQAKAWTVAQLEAALDALLELDAMVKGAPGSESDESQRRLAFTLWIVERVGRPD
ncbi:MAG: DNA polymerase III subunit delta [Chloroflexota bacterium]